MLKWLLATQKALRENPRAGGQYSGCGCDVDLREPDICIVYVSEQSRLPVKVIQGFVDVLDRVEFREVAGDKIECLEKLGIGEYDSRDPGMYMFADGRVCYKEKPFFT